jgi:hypothetical protein
LLPGDEVIDSDLDDSEGDLDEDPDAEDEGEVDIVFCVYDKVGNVFTAADLRYNASKTSGRQCLKMAWFTLTAKTISLPSVLGGFGLHHALLTISEFEW